MNSIEAMIYCLGYISDKPEDGSYKSQTCYDKDKSPHWFEWSVTQKDFAIPIPCSESPDPFCKIREPYSTGENQ